jgi:hypothetical protein
MAKSNPKNVEFEPDAWGRFERAVDVVVKSPPQHRTKAKPKAKRGKSPAAQKRKLQTKKPSR